MRRICHICGNTLEYDSDKQCLFCSECNSQWDYTEYKIDKELYNDNPSLYATIYNYEKIIQIVFVSPIVHHFDQIHFTR